MTKIRKRKIRIFIDDTYMKSQNNEKYSIMINALQDSVNNWSKILKVERLEYKLSKSMFSNCEVNAFHSDLEGNKGVEADLIIFPSFTSIEQGYYAESAICQRDSQSFRSIYLPQYITDTYLPRDRPIAGYIKISVDNNTSKRNSNIFFTNLFMHEIGHILGFTLEVYEPFLIERSINGRTRKLISSPKVIEAARRHFNCPTLEGVEIEDDGKELSKYKHWESRIMNGDIMVSLVDRADTAISEITLAFFEDTNWYETKTYTGGLFRTGKGRGCSFLTDNCNSYKSHFGNDFVYDNKENCSPSRLSRGYYSVEDYADRCPIVSKYWSNEYFDHSYDYFPTSCIIGVNDYDGYGENISPNSICVLTKASPTDSGNSASRIKVACVKATCTKNFLYRL